MSRFEEMGDEELRAEHERLGQDYFSDQGSGWVQAAAMVGYAESGQEIARRDASAVLAKVRAKAAKRGHRAVEAASKVRVGR